MQLVTKDYQGHAVTFNGEGWINATTEAAKHGKRVDVWLKTKETQEYIDALCEMSHTTKRWYLKTSKATLDNGGGTWLHPKLAVMFARWLDPKFAIWCDMQIDALIRGKDDWRKLRHQSASSFKVANDILKMVREANDKDTEDHHYMNEARLVNWVLTGEFKGVDRETLSAGQLDLLAHLQERNAVLIGRGLEYQQRKNMLKSYAMDWKMALIGGVAA